MRLAFYLEPAIFRNNPGFLYYHILWFKKIIQSLNASDGDIITFISTKALFLKFTEEISVSSSVSIQHIAIDPVRALDAFNGALSGYSKDLYQTEEAATRNFYLEAQIKEAFEWARPDLIICSSENRYVVRNRPKSSMLFFIEKLPLPSWLQEGELYYDPIGHQSLGMLSRYWSEIVSESYSEIELDGAGAILANVERRKTTSLTSDSVRHVASLLNPDRKVMLVALQPNEWLSWEGALNTEDRPLDLLLRVASEFPDHQILPTFHKDMHIGDDTSKHLSAVQTNIIALPSALSVGNSELFLSIADHVYSVSSAVGISALIYGAGLISDANSFLAPGSLTTKGMRSGEHKVLSPSERTRLVAFLKYRYGKKASELTNLDAFRQHESSLLSVVRKPALKSVATQARETAKKFATLDFSYCSYKHFRDMAAARGSYTVNLGDYIQSIGVRRALCELGIPESEIMYVDRDSLSEYRGPPVKLIMNGVFTPSNFPLSGDIDPIFFGFSYHPDNIIPSDNAFMFEESFACLVGKLIGCRDTATADFLASKGFRTYVTGCLSQSFAPLAFLRRQLLPVLICGIDNPDAEAWLKAAFPNHIRLENQRRGVIEHPLPIHEMEACRSSAEALIAFYARHVSLVFTSLMHCAGPSASMGIPTVIVRRDPENIRFTDISGSLPIVASDRVARGAYGAAELRDVAAILQRRSNMLGALAKAIGRQ